MVYWLTIQSRGAVGLLATCVLFGACTGCIMDNPVFDEDEFGAGTGDPATTGPEPTTSDSDTGVASESETGLGDTGGEDPIGPGAGALAIPASFSACRGSDYSPSECALSAGEGLIEAIVIDQTSDQGHLLVACMTFTIDAEIADQTITQVILEMHTVDKSNSSSDAAGEIWAVEAFTEADFTNALPPKIGVLPLAPSPGPAKSFKPVYWNLPLDLVTPNAPIYLCAYPLSGDGAYYYSHASVLPPVLYVEYE